MRSDLDEIEILLPGLSQCLGELDDADLFAVGADEPDAGDLDLRVDPLLFADAGASMSMGRDAGGREPPVAWPGRENGDPVGVAATSGPDAARPVRATRGGQRPRVAVPSGWDQRGPLVFGCP